jgi:hypothetical protein
MSESKLNEFITYLFSHNGIDPQDSRKVSKFLNLTTEADILQITDAKLRDVPGLSAWYRRRIVGAAWVYRQLHGYEQVDVIQSSYYHASIPKLLLRLHRIHS